MKRRPTVIVTLLTVGLLVTGVMVYLAVRPPGQGTSRPDHTEPGPPPANALAHEDQARLPTDRVLLPAAAAAECRGLVVSAESRWGAKGLREKSVLWDEAKRHLVVLLPNEKRARLQEQLSPK
jgi:hypothetical protein